MTQTFTPVKRVYVEVYGSVKYNQLNKNQLNFKIYQNQPLRRICWFLFLCFISYFDFQNSINY